MEKKPNSSEQLVEGNGAQLLQHFNLSRNKYFRTLETTAESIMAAGTTAHDFLKTILSSVASPVPINIVIIYRERDFSSVPRCKFCDPGTDCFTRNPLLMTLGLGVFHEMHDAQDFRLVLCADVSHCAMEHNMEMLKVIAKAAQLPHEPLIVSEIRTLRTRPLDCNVDWSGQWPITASVL